MQSICDDEKYEDNLRHLATVLKRILAEDFENTLSGAEQYIAREYFNEKNSQYKAMTPLESHQLYRKEENTMKMFLVAFFRTCHS